MMLHFRVEIDDNTISPTLIANMLNDSFQRTGIKAEVVLEEEVIEKVVKVKVVDPDRTLSERKLSELQRGG